MTRTFINAAAIVLNAAIDVTFFGTTISILEATCFVVILIAILLHSNLARHYKPEPWGAAPPFPPLHCTPLTRTRARHAAAPERAERAERSSISTAAAPSPLPARSTQRAHARPASPSHLTMVMVFSDGELNTNPPKPFQ